MTSVDPPQRCTQPAPDRAIVHPINISSAVSNAERERHGRQRGLDLPPMCSAAGTSQLQIHIVELHSTVTETTRQVCDAAEHRMHTAVVPSVRIAALLVPVSLAAPADTSGDEQRKSCSIPILSTNTSSSTPILSTNTPRTPTHLTQSQLRYALTRAQHRT